MRKYLRSIARANMRRAGIHKPTKPGYGGRSFFARNWRGWV